MTLSSLFFAWNFLPSITMTTIRFDIIVLVLFEFLNRFYHFWVESYLIVAVIWQIYLNWSLDLSQYPPAIARNHNVRCFAIRILWFIVSLYIDLLNAIFISFFSEVMFQHCHILRVFVFVIFQMSTCIVEQRQTHY